MSNLLAFIARAFGLLLVQQLILNHMPLGNGLMFAFVLPMAFYMLAFDTPRVQLVLFGFVLGLITDAFESSFGLYTLAFSILGYFIGILRYRFYSREEVDNRTSGILDHHPLKNVPFIFTCNLVVLLAFYLIENFSGSGVGYAILRAFLSAILSTVFMMCIQFMFPSKRIKNR